MPPGPTTGTDAGEGLNQREQAAADARSRILAAAATCIVRDGLAKVRMAAIAREAGVSSGLLHYHFDTKELLFGEVLAYSHRVSTELNDRAVASAGAGPAARLSSFLDRCLPSDERLRHEWMLWQELALLCIRDPHLAKVGQDVYELLYGTVEDILREGVERGDFTVRTGVRELAETAVALTDGLGGRVLAGDLGLAEARTALTTTMGILVGLDEPLPEAAPFAPPPTDEQ
ncbi:AcrR family transcriptional regulator [Nocardioides sp. BE266]|uniref:TetR/AcrR family transcriptional regulator n=1 Tax=Nocardioides sp. BE266 TaxID=2817725 RepID=UPI002865EDF3|nr:TetR/AcrR family transcriptional regulator [Nocardioides sp. BE266]MDR7252536.1 AcrR family transcriptional regulator [Nocardioides sp. BE266]